MYVSGGHKQPAVLNILKNDNRLLLLKRLKEPNKGKFTPIGGKLDPFESPYAAVIRETREETGILVTDIRYCGIMVETSPTNYNWICFTYLSEIDFLDPPECSEGELVWINYAELLKVPTPATDWHIYKYITDRKNFMFNVEYDDQLNIVSIKEEIENRQLPIHPHEYDES
jgi:8-oxo-dGTP diphosphatase